MAMRIGNVKRQAAESVKRGVIRVRFNETLSIGNRFCDVCQFFRVAISVCPGINPLGVWYRKYFWNQPWNPFVHSLAFE
jgi:hypothetical protein